MKSEKRWLLTAIVYVILFVVYHLVVFLIFNEKSDVFWISYGFMVLAFAAQFASIVLAFRKTDVETVFYGIPLASLSIYYILAELFCSLSFMIFQNAGVKAALIVQVILVAMFVIVAIISLASRDTVHEIGRQVKENVGVIKSLHVDVEMMMERCEDAELKVKLRKLSETIRYSDPMTHSSIADIEQKIMRALPRMGQYCDSGQFAEAKKACADLEILFAERNKKLFISK